MNRITLFLGLLIVPLCIFGQEKAKKAETSKKFDVSIDLDQRSVSSTLPYDEFVEVLVKTKVQLHDTVSIFQTRFRDKKLKSKSLTKSEFEKFRAAEPKLKVLGENSKSLLLTKEGKNYRTKLPPLLPNKLYELIFWSKTTTSQLDAILKFQHLNYDEDFFDATIYPWFVVPNQTKQPGKIPAHSEFKDFIEQNISLPAPGLLTVALPSISDTDIRNISNKMNTKRVNVDSLSEVLVGLISETNYDYTQVVKGLATIKVLDKLCEEHEIGQRVKNLKQSIVIVEAAEKELKSLLIYFADDIDVSHFYTEFSGLKTILKGNLKKLSGYSKNLNSILDAEYQYPISVTQSTGNTTSKENKVHYLVSDFGLINAWGDDQFGELEYIGRPFFGLNWHVGGMKKGKRLNQMTRRRFWNRFSVAIGVTLGNIDEGGYEDFFNNLSPSLGLNCRLTQDVRIGVGGLLLNKNRNPIVDNEGIAIRPYVSISFDYRLFSDLIIASRIFN